MKFSAIAVLGSVAAYKADDKMKIDLFYESQCPGCRGVIAGSFTTAMQTPGFTEMATVTLHPYGNARESAGSDGQWNFQCQHGAVECQYNLMEACALNYYKDTITTANVLPSFEFIKCVEANDSASNYE